MLQCVRIRAFGGTSSSPYAAIAVAGRGLLRLQGPCLRERRGGVAARGAVGAQHPVDPRGEIDRGRARGGERGGRCRDVHL